MSIEFEILADAMDKREKYFKLLEGFKNKYGFVPKGHEIRYVIWKLKDTGKPWRENKRIVKRIKKAAKKIQTTDAKIKYLVDKYKKDEEEVRKLYQYLKDWKQVIKTLEARTSDN